jgi:predicted deacetylase
MTAPLAHLSIHDVKPSTLERTEELLALCRPAAGSRVTCLVVPGLDWTRPQVARLHSWATEGVELAGHGWLHQGVPPRSLHHRLHSLVLSRDQAEHLSRTREELLGLVRRGAAWFREQGLPEPELYVPPAWALGALSYPDLAGLPYRWYEVLTGFIDGRAGRLHPTPLVGYEADTGFRRRALRLTNRAARRLALATGRPLRIGLHPRDLELLLADDLVRELADPRWRYLTTAETLATLTRTGEPAGSAAQRLTE